MPKTVKAGDLAEENKCLTETVRELRSEIFRLKSVINELPGSIYWKDKDGVYLGRNRFSAEMMYQVGFEPEVNIDYVIGKTDQEMFEPETAEQYQRNDAEVMREQKTLTREELVKLPTGEIQTQLSIKRPLYNEQGEVVGILGNTLDMSDKKRIEALSHQLLSAELELNYTTVLSGAIAHELRTPLTALTFINHSLDNYLGILIKSYQDLVLLRADVPKIPARQLEALNDVAHDMHASIRSAFHFIDMLLIKINQKKILSTDLAIGRISEAINQSLKEYPFEDHERELIHLDLAVDFEYLGDATLTKHIFFNLFKNALYYIRDVHKGEIYISTFASEDYNGVIFRDTAKGIESETLAHIFDKFTSKRSGGTGLGLAFCKLVMQLYNGEITCESEFGQYTEFKLFFPRVL